MPRQQSEKEQGSQSIEPRRRSQLLKEENWFSPTPFGMMRRFADEMDRVFGMHGVPSRMFRSSPWLETGDYMPQVDIFEREGKLVLRADLPGMTKESVNVDISADTVIIEGERKYEHEANEEGVYRSERSYGHFRREIPLPEGVKTDTATAKFKDGVLEVTLDAPPASPTRRRIQIQSAA